MNTTLKIFVDSDVFVALTVGTDANHDKALSLIRRLRETPVRFFTSNYVFSESITIISQRASHATAVKYIDQMQSLDSPFLIKRADENLEEEALHIFKQQTSKNTSYVDCTNMAFMNRLQADAIFSFDGDYRKNRLTLVAELLEAEEQKAA